MIPLDLHPLGQSVPLVPLVPNHLEKKKTAGIRVSMYNVTDHYQPQNSWGS